MGWSLDKLGFLRGVEVRIEWVSPKNYRMKEKVDLRRIKHDK